MPIRLVIFDVDGTVLQLYSWQHVHQQLGTWTQAKKHKQRFFRGQISYQEWARLDTALWKNRSLRSIRHIVNRVPYTEGATRTLSTLKQRSIRTYLLSAGLTLAAEKIQRETGAVDGYTANSLVVEDDVLTGRVVVNVVYTRKDKHLHGILREFDAKPEECATVGDDPSLISLFRKVALTIAFNPTDSTVAEHADAVVTSKDLRDILPHILEQRQEIRTPTAPE